MNFNPEPKLLEKSTKTLYLRPAVLEVGCAALAHILVGM